MCLTYFQYDDVPSCTCAESLTDYTSASAFAPASAPANEPVPVPVPVASFNSHPPVYECRLPSWIGSPRNHLLLSLSMLTVQVLRDCGKTLKVDRAYHLHSSELRPIICDRFITKRAYYTSLDYDELLELLASTNYEGDKCCRVRLMSYLLRKEFGPTVFDILRIPEDKNAQNNDVSVDAVRDWLRIDEDIQKKNLKRLSKSELMLCLHRIHPSRRPAMPYRRTLSTVLDVESDLWSYDIPMCHIRDKDEEALLRRNKPASEHRKKQESERRKRDRRTKKVADVTLEHQTEKDTVASWPQKIPESTILQCLNDYRTGTDWKPSPVCAVCARARSVKHVEHIIYKNLEISLPAHLDILVSQYTRHTPLLSPETRHLCIRPDMECLILDHHGLRMSSDNDADANVNVTICTECDSSLDKREMPRFALANFLYRGHLPDEFKDLTWVEEMVCSIYRVTAHVTRLYVSEEEDLEQPLVFKGNTCAHNMNTVSTATTLPRTPSDMNDCLTVVFMGPEKFKKKSLRTTFVIRKEKVWKFLQWLKVNNILYRDLPYDVSILDLYDDNDIIPGIEDRVLIDTETDPATAFAEETAGLSDHPGMQMHESNEKQHGSMSSEIFLEKMGVSDANGETISGRAYTASAIRNLLPKNSKTPDLVIHHGSNAIPEYNNPSLLPGMFPTLYPFGTGGFEDKRRVTPLGFDNQADYYLDLHDRSFRYHQFFIFVVFNIWQRRLSHRFTAFTVRKSHFDKVAKDLTSLTEPVLTEVARHLENEGNTASLSADGQKALKLLGLVNTISSHVPGSQASKLLLRNEIRSYFGTIGLPHIFLTMNPHPGHSPIFQVMFGDTTVDLSDRFPKVPSSSERARRLAKDPVAAADFFDYSIRQCFEHLLGWDFKEGKSKPLGGILGKLRAFYGTAEYTERGSLHGHFLIWLVGGLNPSELHEKLKNNDAYQKQFFDYWESVIKHDLPPDEVPIEKDHDPRTERPPIPPEPNMSTRNDPEEQKRVRHEWDIVQNSEVKILGEKFQRHICRPVCHKYGHINDCRFHFPHEIVEKSNFDEETNSINLACRDPFVNYYNPFLLTFCRHNHDIKCILSGKAAKAAMFYITDYITKSELKTYQVMSLLAKAILNVPSPSINISPLDQAKTLFHKCVSQFIRRQQIHAQQAARYLRGHDDHISSHRTVPMLSGIMISYIQNQYNSVNATRSDITDNTDGDESEDDADSDKADSDNASSDNGENSNKTGDNEDNGEECEIKIILDDDGRLRETNQIHDYLYRSQSLADMSFYNFVRYVRLEKTTRSPKNTPETRLGVHARHLLLPAHPLHKTHVLVEHTNIERGDGSRVIIPRVVGCSIPRSHDTKTYPMFCLAHFKPFSVDNPLCRPNVSIEETFKTYSFDSDSLRIMKNWEAIHECEDEREAERIRKQKNSMRESAVLFKSLNKPDDDDDDDDYETFFPSSHAESKAESDAKRLLRDLVEAGWFNSNEEVNDRSIECSLSPQLLRTWKAAVKQQESVIRSLRQNASNIHAQTMSTILETENIQHLHQHRSLSSSSLEQTAFTEQTSDTRTETAEASISRVAKDFHLNERQLIAFVIAAKAFLADRHHSLNPQSDHPEVHKPLRMLLMGPGGTGKTHVVNALRSLMASFNCEHQIRFLAPTGTAASLIDGMTIHKGLGIKLKQTETTNSKYEDVSVHISVRSRSALRAEWKDVRFVLIDEVSMLGQELLCEIDHALRYAKERRDEWFGGINVIFSGDFYQYPPVGSSPLYTPLSSHPKQTSRDLLKRLGRMAWKSVNTVIELTEQQRMSQDPEYAAAVNRQRIRQCIPSDVILFNSRAVKSSTNPDGILLSECPEDVVALVQTNLVREALNNKKAYSVSESNPNVDLVYCAAQDKINGQPAPSRFIHDLLKLNVQKLKSQNVLPGIIPLYVGMPVILRCRNLSTELGITNGAQGIVRKIETTPISEYDVAASCVIVEFPNSKVQLPGLPPRHFPIEPVSCTFKTYLHIDGQLRKVKITRYQLSLQLGFAITGHCAQGKTLLAVLCGLHESGFAAYVAISRAKSRQGLFLTHPVTLAQLNTPIPENLLLETRRLSALAHNTLVNEHVIEQCLIAVPDPESAPKTLPVQHLVEESTSRKRRRTCTGGEHETITTDFDTCTSSPPAKRTNTRN